MSETIEQRTGHSREYWRYRFAEAMLSNSRLFDEYIRCDRTKDITPQKCRDNYGYMCMEYADAMLKALEESDGT